MQTVSVCGRSVGWLVQSRQLSDESRVVLRWQLQWLKVHVIEREDEEQEEDNDADLQPPHPAAVVQVKVQRVKK